MTQSLVKRICLMTITLGCLFSGATAKLSSNDTMNQIDAHDKIVIEYWLAGLRGLWTGYYNEFYHHKKIDPRCFSDESEAEIC